MDGAPEEGNRFVKSRSDPVTFTHRSSGWTGVHTCISDVCSYNERTERKVKCVERFQA